ncbi:MAG: hypothetical protein ACETVY_05695 [Candidatus Bathyarchaeia archaeon]
MPQNHMNLSEKENEIVWWIIGGIFFVFGLKYLMEGSYSDALVHMALGLVIIAAGSEELRRVVTEFFLSLFMGLWKNVLK